MKLPFYGTVGIRPVKALRTDDGGIAVYTMNWQSGEFELDMSYLSKIYEHDDVDWMSREAFEQYVTELKAERGL